MITFSQTFTSRGDKTPWHKHREWQRIEVKKGEISLCLKLQAGDVVAIPPNVEHDWLALEDARVDDCYTVDFSNICNSYSPYNP